jgi:phenylacetate-CoA ligase
MLVAADAIELSARAIEHATRKEIQAYQSQQLACTMEILRRAPYWKRRFERESFTGRGLAPDSLFDAPTLDKHQYFAALTADPDGYGGLLTSPLEDICSAGAITYRTTGTSGKQGRFINTTSGFQIFGNQGHEMIREAGGRPGDGLLITWPLFFWAASWGFYYASFIGPYLAVPAGPPADTQMRIDLIKQYRPAIVVSTPSYALTLGQAARTTNVVPSDFGVRGLLIGGETFGETKRNMIEELWGIPGGTRNFYGISEGGPLFAVECRHQNGLHLFEGDTIHQFWKPGKNEPADPGDISEHVFTSISQRAMATWFNFRTRDGARYTDEPCDCGRHTRRMWIAERLDDMVKVKGVNVFASGVEDLLSPVSGVGREFRLVIDRVGSRDSLTLQIEVDSSADEPAIRAHIHKAMTSAWGINFDVECLKPGALPRTEGKARRWQDRRPKES